ASEPYAGGGNRNTAASQNLHSASVAEQSKSHAHSVKVLPSANTVATTRASIYQPQLHQQKKEPGGSIAGTQNVRKCSNEIAEQNTAVRTNPHDSQGHSEQLEYQGRTDF